MSVPMKKKGVQKKAEKVYCAQCRFFLSGKSNPLHQDVCLATAHLSGDAISEEGDVVGLVLPTERNKRNNCSRYRKMPFLHLRKRDRNTEAILRVMATPVPQPGAASRPKQKEAKSKTSASEEVATLAAEMVASMLEDTLQPLVMRIEQLEEKADAKVERPEEPVGRGTALPPFVRRGDPIGGVQSNPPPLRAALDPIEGEQPDSIGGPM